jgi:peptide chain release factor 3
MQFSTEIQRRRTFGIISHPDAGKQLLLKNFYYLVEQFKKLEQLKITKLRKGLLVILWKLNAREEFRLPHQF